MAAPLRIENLFSLKHWEKAAGLRGLRPALQVGKPENEREGPCPYSCGKRKSRLRTAARYADQRPLRRESQAAEPGRGACHLRSESWISRWRFWCWSRLWFRARSYAC